MHRELSAIGVGAPTLFQADGLAVVPSALL